MSNMNRQMAQPNPAPTSSPEYLIIYDAEAPDTQQLPGVGTVDEAIRACTDAWVGARLHDPGTGKLRHIIVLEEIKP
jgi:hypothetical protein